ncbi:hypothetical protein [Pseudomonas pseudonitroreducens]|uniref:hypothetical protein n=1 Tax=Pseudomonas pseudonitroreducens TaxID=2892326 RepID=UPI001F336053|nr:hypothetical protein [Pseudomonas pseudonitroreducens]
MTSDTKQFEGQEDHEALAASASEPSEQTDMSSSSDRGTERKTPLSRLANAVSLRAKGASRPHLSTGYIPINTKASAAQSTSQVAAAGEVGNPPHAGQDDSMAVLAATEPVGDVPVTGAPVLEAFELFERDLIELASACSDLGSGSEQSDHGGVAEPGLKVSSPDPTVAPAAAQPASGRYGPSRTVPADTTAASIFSQSLPPVSHSSYEEPSTMNASDQLQQEKASSSASLARASAEPAFQSSVMETDGVLHDVQSTLDSLAGMAHGLSQQKMEVVKMREALDERRQATIERERQLAEREDRLAQMEQRLQEEKYDIERVAEQNSAVLAERSSALQALAETVDSRDRATSKRAEVLNQEQQGIERQLNQMRARIQELDDREAGLQRQGAELADRFKQLLDAKERFGVIVKGFNETVRFNTTYSAISKSVTTSEDA